MKVSLDQKGDNAVKLLAERVYVLNPSAHRSLSALINEIVVEFSQSALPSQFSAVASRLTTPKGRRCTLMKMVQSLAENADDESLKVLEKKLSKMNLSSERKEENTA